MQDMVGGNKERIKDAPVLIVSTFERGKSGFFHGNPTNEFGEGWGAYDNGLSNCYLILKARAMGFDTLIMGMRDADALRGLFSIPSNETSQQSFLWATGQETLANQSTDHLMRLPNSSNLIPRHDETFKIPPFPADGLLDHDGRSA